MMVAMPVPQKKNRQTNNLRAVYVFVENNRRENFHVLAGKKNRTQSALKRFFDEPGRIYFWMIFFIRFP